MSVGRRLLLSLITLSACAAILGGVALSGLLSARHHDQTAEEQYESLRSLYEVGHHAASVQMLLRTDAASAHDIRQHLMLAMRAADTLTLAGAEDIRAELHTAAQRLADHDNPTAARSNVNEVLNTIATSAGATERDILANRQQATTQYETVLRIVAGTFTFTLLVTLIVGIKQYRAIMTPLRTLDAAVTQLHHHALGRRIPAHGDREFRQLMTHFNRMSGALEHVHASLQEQVEAKSRQLVRSEQLASVGYLAAGLAHEINNPLGIIAGYAETSLRRIRSAPRNTAPHDILRRVESTLEIICEEAFRCRDITHDLLRMARPLESELEPMAVAPLIERAISLVHGLPIAHEREIIFRSEDTEGEIICPTVPSQLLQVLINLLTNALEATSPNVGRVLITLEQQAGVAAITVADNGCGMTDATLRHAFDPFFTEKQRRGQDGCGLGLSVSHAIIERHGGKLLAGSEGRNCGSIFTIEMPLCAETSSPMASFAHAT